VKTLRSFFLVRCIHLALLLVLLSAALFGVQKQSAKPTPEGPAKSTLNLPFEDARRMTVKLSVRGEFQSRGSAVWIGKTGYLATCYHVVEGVMSRRLIVGAPHDAMDFTSGSLNVGIRGTMTVIDVTIAASDKGTNVAILHSDHPPGQPEAPPIIDNKGRTADKVVTSMGATLEVNFPKPGQTMLLAGYPLSEQTLILQTGIATDMNLYRQSIAVDVPLGNALRIILSLVSNPGNSGGPVLDAAGKVVGLLEGNIPSPIRDENGNQVYAPREKLDSSGNPILDALRKPTYEDAPLSQNSGISVVVPAKFIVDLAKNNKIDLR